MPTNKFIQPNYTSQSGTAYPANIDAAVAVLAEVGAAFAPRAQDVPNMTVRVDAGRLPIGNNVLHVAAQDTVAFTAPLGNPRIDRVVIDNATGAVSVLIGTPAASPTAPAITDGKTSVCQVLLQTSSTTITNAMITDERGLSPVVFTTAYSRSLLAAANAAAARATLALGALATLSSVPNGALDGPALGFLLRANVLASNAASITLTNTYQTIVSVNLGTVVAGDIILFDCPMRITGVTGTAQMQVLKSSGTAGVYPGAYHPGNSVNTAVTPVDISTSGMFHVETGGTLILRADAMDSGNTGFVGVGFSHMRCLVLKGG